MQLDLISLIRSHVKMDRNKKDMGLVINICILIQKDDYAGRPTIISH